MVSRLLLKRMRKRCVPGSFFPPPTRARVRSYATHTLRLSIIKTLGMVNPFIVSRSPHKENIHLSVASFKSIEYNFLPLATELLEKRQCAARTIIYCQRLNDCADVFAFFKAYLGPHLLISPLVSDHTKYRLSFFVDGTLCSPDVLDVINCSSKFSVTFEIIPTHFPTLWMLLSCWHLNVLLNLCILYFSVLGADLLECCTQVFLVC